jgi:hypothetical protein
MHEPLQHSPLAAQVLAGPRQPPSLEPGPPGVVMEKHEVGLVKHLSSGTHARRAGLAPSAAQVRKSIEMPGTLGRSQLDS